MVNSDLSSKGGIASVVKTYYAINNKRGHPIKFQLLKTNYYKEKNKLFELILFISSLLTFIYLLSKSDIDIVHIQSSHGFSFFRKAIFLFIGRLFKKKNIIHVHSSNFYDFFIGKNILLSKFCQVVFNYTDLIIVLCKDWEIKIKKKYHLKSVITLHNPIILDKLNNKKYKKNGLNILFLGFLIKSKGILDIIALIKKLQSTRIKNIKITIAGKGELEQNIVNFCSNKNSLSNYFEFKGWVEGSKKKDLLQSADVFFLPSYNEGMPISILEAMSYNLPIIATKIAGVPELVMDGINGYLFKPGDIEGYYNALLELSKDRSKLLSMGRESLRIVKNFDADIIFDKLLTIYNKILYI